MQFSTVVKTALAGGVALLIATTFVQVTTDPAIIISPVALPTALASMNAVELTHRLADHIDSVKRDARPSPEHQRYSISGDIKVPDVEVPLTQTTLPKLIALARNALGRDAKEVTWEIGAHPKDASSPNWVVAAHMPGRPSHQASFDPTNPDQALAAIARGVLGDVEPLVLARALLYDGHCEEARRVALQMLRREAVHGRAQSSAMNFLGQTAECDNYPVGSNYSDAIRYYRGASAADPDNGLPHANLGRMFAMRARDDALAAEGRKASLDSMTNEFRMGTRLSPMSAGVHEAWGWSLVATDSPREALQHLSEAIKLEPRSAPAYFTRAAANHQLGDLSAAATDYAMGLARSPDSIRYLKAYGHELVLLKDWKGAAGAFARAALLDSTDIDTKFYLGCSLRRYNQYAGGVILDTVIQRFSNTPTSGYYTQSKLALATDTVSCQ